MPSKKATPPKKAIKPVAKLVAKKSVAKPAAKPVAKKPAVAKKAKVKPTAKKPVAKPVPQKPISKPAAKKPALKPAAKKTALKPAAKKSMPKPATKKLVLKPVTKKQFAKPVVKAPPVKPAPKPAPAKKTSANLPIPKPVKGPISSLITPGVKFVKAPFFIDIDKEERGKRKFVSIQRPLDKPTASSRPKIGNVQDTKSLVELLSQQLELENKMFFEGCEGQTCVKCNNASVDQKYYVDKSLGYCIECAIRLGLGQSKEGVFSDVQMDLMRRSMEKTMGNVKDIDEDDIESAFDDIDSLELEEALLAVEEDIGD